MAVPTFDVSIAAHYVPKRIPYLAEVLKAIVEWDRPSVSVTLVTNDIAIADEPLVAQAQAALEKRGFAVRYDVTHGMAHPWHLTWWHKAHMREWFAREGTPEDLFMYIEDDIVVDAGNVAYFTRELPRTRAVGCLPGFLRFEKRPDGVIMSPDYLGYQIVQPQEQMTIAGQAYVAPTFPYWAGFILDRELCAEYLASPWSDLEKADTMPQSHKHSCRVQSAWALTYWNVPPGLHSRYVVPVDKDLSPLQECRVWHSADNYSVSNQYSFGTVRMDEIFRKPGLKAAIDQVRWRAAALGRRLSDKLAREAAKRRKAA